MQQELSYVLVDLYLKRGRNNDAIALMAPLVTADPNLVPARLLLGLAHLANYNSDEALKQFTKVVELNPKATMGHYYLGRTLLARGDVEGAKRHYQKALELEPNAKQIRIEMAGFSGQKPDDALLAAQITELKAGVERQPNNLSARNALARAYMLRNQPKEAEEEYKKILQAAPAFVPANLAMAIIRARERKDDEVVAHLKTIINAEPAHLQANAMLGDYYERKGNFDLATKHLETVHRAVPTAGGVKLRLAALYARAGRADEGLARVKEVIAAQPKSAPAYLVAGELQLQKGNLSQATEALTTAIRLDPKLTAAHYALGSVYERAKDTDKAIAAYRKALALNPKSAAALNNLAYLQASRGENLAEALTFAQTALELAPQSPLIMDTVGFVHYQRKEYAKAEPVLKKAADLGAKIAPIHYHLGMTYYRLGKKEDAVASLKRSLQLDERFPEAAEARKVLKDLGAS
jgi:tetratricopeptide (TPR) repeat protein